MAKRTRSDAGGGTAAAARALPASKPTDMQVRSVPLASISVDGSNARIDSPDDAAQIESLAASMATIGLQQPIRLCPAGSEDRPAPGYQVVFGHRRLEAARLLKWETIPATIGPAYGDVALERATENVQRDDLNPIERAIAVGELMDRATREVEEKLGVDPCVGPATPAAADAVRKQAIEAVASRLGKTPAWVRDHVFLGTLDKTTRGLVVDGRLPWEHARELAKIADPAKRAELAKRAAVDPSAYAGSPRREQPLTLRDLRGMVAPHLRSLADVPWRLDVEFAGTHACEHCPENSRNQTGLFEHHAPQYDRWKTGKEPEAGVCLNAACYGRKSGLANRQITSAARKVQATVSAAPKADREKVQCQAVAKLAPAVVRPGAFAAAAKDRLAAMEEAKKAPARSQPRAETPESKAKRAFDEAQRSWVRELDRMVGKAVRERPVVFHLLTAASNVEFPSGKAGKAQLLDIVEAVFDPGRTDVLDLICKKKLRKYADVYWEHTDRDVESAVLKLVADRLGVKPKKPEPKLESFMRRPRAEKPAAGGRTKAAKGKASCLCGNPVKKQGDVCADCRAGASDAEGDE